MAIVDSEIIARLIASARTGVPDPEAADAASGRQLKALTQGELVRPHVVSKMVLMEIGSLSADEVANILTNAKGLPWKHAHNIAREKVDAKAVADAKADYAKMTPQQKSEHFATFEQFLPKRNRQKVAEKKSAT